MQESGNLVDHDSLRFLLSLIIRLFNAFTTVTFFQPDEYYQSWEVAYSDVTGVGFRSWEWLAGIRSSLVPRVFQIIILVSQSLHINYLTVGKVLMAILAAVADLYTSRLAELFSRSRDLGRIAWMLSTLSMFNFYCSTRPFSNTFEMVLVVVSLYHWYQRSTTQLTFAMVLAHVSIALRPSVAILWLVIGLDSLYQARTMKRLLKIVLTAIMTTVIVQGCIIALDKSYYGGLRLPYYEFVKYNFGENISEIYGTHPWHWYLSQGLPFLLFGYIPFVALGWSKSPLKLRIILLINIVAFSAIKHKEFRFLYFLLPLFHIISAIGYRRSPWYLRGLAVTVNIVAALYFTWFHQRGVMDVVKAISETPEIKEVSFIMPCHSTPWHAYFQRSDEPDFKPQFLTCEPPWNRTSVDYVDEADQFYSKPIAFLRNHPEKLTEHIVLFEPLTTLLGEMGYEITQRFYNGLFNEDSRRQGDVVIMRRKQH